MSDAAAFHLVRGRWVVTGGEPGDSTLTDGAVLVRGDRIEEVGPWAALRARHPGAAVSGSDRVAVVPGLISAHHHSTGVTSTQQGIVDDVLELWILEMRRVRPGDPYLDTLLASARLLRSGVTTLVDLARMTWPWTAPEVDPRDFLVLRAQARDVRTVYVGGRVVMEDGRPTGFDIEAAGRELADRLAATPFPAELAARIAALREHAETFYRGWDVPALDPYTRYNSRT